MYLTISQYARKANVSYDVIVKRVERNTLQFELIEGKKMIDTEKFPPLPKQKAGVKKGMKNALKKEKL